MKLFVFALLLSTQAQAVTFGAVGCDQLNETITKLDGLAAAMRQNPDDLKAASAFYDAVASLRKLTMDNACGLQRVGSGPSLLLKYPSTLRVAKMDAFNFNESGKVTSWIRSLPDGKKVVTSFDPVTGKFASRNEF